MIFFLFRKKNENKKDKTKLLFYDQRIRGLMQVKKERERKLGKEGKITKKGKRKGKIEEEKRRNVLQQT